MTKKTKEPEIKPAKPKTYEYNFLQAMEAAIEGKSVKCNIYPERTICITSAGIGFKNQIGSILLQHKFINAKWQILD